MRFKCELAAFLLISACSPESSASALLADSQNSEVEMERVMLADPDAGAIFVGFKKDFPDHYEGIKRRGLEAMRQGASPQEGKEIGRAAIQSFVEANRRNMAVAPTANLMAYAHAQVQLLETMQREHVQMCANYSMGDKRPSAYVSTPTRQDTSKVALTMIQAARQGIDHPVDRLYQTISEEDADAYAAAIARQRVSASDIELFSDEQKLAQASASQQCAAGLLNARILASLPPEAMARWVAYMITR